MASALDGVAAWPNWPHPFGVDAPCRVANGRREGEASPITSETTSDACFTNEAAFVEQHGIDAFCRRRISGRDHRLAYGGWARHDSKTRSISATV